MTQTCHWVTVHLVCCGGQGRPFRNSGRVPLVDIADEVRLTASKSLRAKARLIEASRHSALPLIRGRVEPVVRSVGKRSAALLLGSTLIGAAVGFLVQANLGLAPYDVLSSGLENRLGVSLSQAGWILAAVLFVVWSALRHRPRIWGIGYILANGIAVDITDWLLNQPASMPARLAFVFVAIVTMAIGINIVLYSGTAGGPFELLMLAGEDHGINRMHTRYFLDVSVLILGVVLGGTFGAATVIYAAFMGLALQGISQLFLGYDTGRSVRFNVNVAQPSDPNRAEPYLDGGTPPGH